MTSLRSGNIPAPQGQIKGPDRTSTYVEGNACLFSEAILDDSPSRPGAHCRPAVHRPALATLALRPQRSARCRDTAPNTITAGDLLTDRHAVTRHAQAARNWNNRFERRAVCKPPARSSATMTLILRRPRSLRRRSSGAQNRRIPAALENHLQPQDHDRNTPHARLRRRPLPHDFQELPSCPVSGGLGFAWGAVLFQQRLIWITVGCRSLGECWYWGVLEAP